MNLTLSVTSYHRFTSNMEENKTLSNKNGNGVITIGRSSQCSWCLPDPERIISGRHAKIEVCEDKFLLFDMSTNGVFVNRAVEPLMKEGKPYVLSHGDMITIGDYEITVDLDEEMQGVKSDVTQRVASASTCFSEPSEQEFGIPLDALIDDVFFLPGHAAEELSIPENWHPSVSSSETEEENKEVRNVVRSSADNNSRIKYHDKVASFSNEECISNELKYLKAFLEGMGISEEFISQDNPVFWWNQLGIVTRGLLDGVMNTLHNRASFKESSRINQTTFQRSENNPLKFSANAEDAIHNLLQRKTAGFLSPEKAVTQAFHDLEKHEKSMLAGVQGAVSGVMEVLNPESIVTRNKQVSSVSQRFSILGRNRNWESYCQIYQKISSELEENSEFFMEDFSKAYEQNLKEVN